jgi:hypothetical protein
MHRLGRLILPRLANGGAPATARSDGAVAASGAALLADVPLRERAAPAPNRLVTDAQACQSGR